MTSEIKWESLSKDVVGRPRLDRVTVPEGRIYVVYDNVGEAVGTVFCPRAAEGSDAQHHVCDHGFAAVTCGICNHGNSFGSGR